MDINAFLAKMNKNKVKIDFPQIRGLKPLSSKPSFTTNKTITFGDFTGLQVLSMVRGDYFAFEVTTKDKRKGICILHSSILSDFEESDFSELNAVEYSPFRLDAVEYSFLDANTDQEFYGFYTSEVNEDNILEALENKKELKKSKTLNILRLPLDDGEIKNIGVLLTTQKVKKDKSSEDTFFDLFLLKSRRGAYLIAKN